MNLVIFFIVWMFYWDPSNKPVGYKTGRGFNRVSYRPKNAGG